MREGSALGIGEIVVLTDPASLKPYVIKMTGPLIRVVGDRFPSSAMSAILEVRLLQSLTSYESMIYSYVSKQTLSILLDKGGANLKAFVPQLQTTFVKNLHEPSKQVRFQLKLSF